MIRAIVFDAHWFDHATRFDVADPKVQFMLVWLVMSGVKDVVIAPESVDATLVVTSGGVAGCESWN